MKALHVDIIAQIIKQYESGTLIKEIEKNLNVSEGTIHRIARKNNLTKRDTKSANEKSGIKRRKVVGDDRAKILELYLSGVPTIEISKMFNINESTVILILKENGGTPDQYNQRRKRNIVDIDKIKNLYENGFSIKHISEKLQISKSIVSDRLKISGTILRPKNGPIYIDVGLCKNMYENGATFKSISEQINVSEWVIENTFKKHKIETRKPNHPDRKELSAHYMRERMKKNGNIRIGKNEYILIQYLKEKYDDVIPQFQINDKGHCYDAFAGNILWELDEPRHKLTKEKNKDIIHDQKALQENYEVRRVWEEDLFKYGLDVWHNYQLQSSSSNMK